MERKIILCIGVLFIFFFSCKKIEEEKQIKVDFTINSFPSNASSGVNPMTLPYFAFNLEIESQYFDVNSGDWYRIIIDSSYVVDSKNNLIAKQNAFSNKKDTLNFIFSNDLSVHETYNLNLDYHIEKFISSTENYKLLIIDGVPQNFTFKSSFTTGDYPYFESDMHANIFPIDNGTLNFLSHPYIVFSHCIDKVYLNTKINRYYKFIIDSTDLYSNTNDILLTTKTFSKNKDSLFFLPSTLLNENSSYSIKLKYHIEIKEKSRDVFHILVKDGNDFHITLNSNFSTTNYNTASIDTSQIEYAYPAPYQYHFLKNETTRGVLKLKLNTKSNLSPSKGMTYKVRISSLTGDSWESQANFDVSTYKLTFQIPTENFLNETIYKIEYISMNSTKVENTFLTYYFRTSMFNNFNDKLNSISVLYQSQTSINGYHLINYNIEEGFDKYENKQLNRLNSYKIISAGTINFERLNKFYTGFNEHSYKLSNNRLPYDIPPFDAVSLKLGQNSTFELTNEQIEMGVAERKICNKFIFESKLFVIYSSDWYYVKQQIDANPNILYDEWESFIHNYSTNLIVIETVKYNFSINYFAGDNITSTYVSENLFFKYF